MTSLHEVEFWQDMGYALYLPPFDKVYLRWSNQLTACTKASSLHAYITSTRSMQDTESPLRGNITGVSTTTSTVDLITSCKLYYKQLQCQVTAKYFPAIHCWLYALGHYCMCKRAHRHSFNGCCCCQICPYLYTIHSLF